MRSRVALNLVQQLGHAWVLCDPALGLLAFTGDSSGAAQAVLTFHQWRPAVPGQANHGGGRFLGDSTLRRKARQSDTGGESIERTLI